MNNNPTIHHSRLIEKKKIAEECYTLLFEGEIRAFPGQFLMLWIPGIDEIPMSVSYLDRNKIGVTVKIVGEATEALCSLSSGNRIRIRGPYGRGFDERGKQVILIAGGVGSAPLLPLAFSLKKQDVELVTIIGARNKEKLVLCDGFEKVGAETVIATDDGTAGFKGTAAQLFSDVLKERAFDSVYCCGPEPMIRAVIEIANDRGIWGQASVERYMRCAIGICGSCAIDSKLVCRDGPIFNFTELLQMKDFGIDR